MAPAHLEYQTKSTDHHLYTFLSSHQKSRFRSRYSDKAYRPSWDRLEYSRCPCTGIDSVLSERQSVYRLNFRIVVAGGLTKISLAGIATASWRIESRAIADIVDRSILAGFCEG